MRIKNKYRKRWFGYFDLLGFSEFVLNNHISEVLDLYNEVLATVNQNYPDDKRVVISKTWFSDTFVFYTFGCTAHEFVKIEMVARLFFQKLILKGIPVRGALTAGPVYTNRKMNIYIGTGLIDAYEYGECQNWLGMVLTPSVYKQLENTLIPVQERAFYRPVPSLGIIRKKDPLHVFAFNFDNGKVNGRNPYIKQLEKMEKEAPETSKIKYRNTLDFIYQNSRK
ncbi:MAG: hypothetical protein AB2799_17825 [Candidatus Thiodiazotropha sp.]